MMKTTLSAIALVLAAGVANADVTAGTGGAFSGSATSFAATGGFSVGNGRTESSAGQFAGSTSTLTIAAEGDQMGGSMSTTVSNESFVEGFDSSFTRGNALSGAIRGGAAFGAGTYWGEGSGNW